MMKKNTAEDLYENEKGCPSSGIRPCRLYERPGFNLVYLRVVQLKKWTVVLLGLFETKGVGIPVVNERKASAV